MTLKAVLKNKVTGSYYSNKGLWKPRKCYYHVETKPEAFKLADRLNCTVQIVK